MTHDHHDLVLRPTPRQTQAALDPPPGRIGGDLVVETLQGLGATTVFGLPGQHALGVFDALRRSDLTFVGLRMENNAGFAADAYGRITGEAAPLLLSTGPGALTSLAALQEAAAASAPVVAISSQVPVAGLGGARCCSPPGPARSPRWPPSRRRPPPPPRSWPSPPRSRWRVWAAAGRAICTSCATRRRPSATS
ncbi:thiamine pyrophosphate-binding protein [Streptomyces sp. ERV7]|uniref:thiamine pyrophosphate-binding protein n=1 Tax=Streptomyces sp. ERV7 TaxID=1322334 RepID=UPI00099FA11B